MEERFKGAVALVTGGAGFIGSHIVERLLQEGVKRVFVVDSLEYGAAHQLPQDPRVVFTQAALETADFNAITEGERVDYLFHLAAKKHNQSIGSPEEFFASNIIGTYRLADFAAKSGVRKAVYSSSLYAYGRRMAPPMREDEVPHPDTLYGISKLSGEHIFAWAATQSSLRYNSVRYFFIYGPKQYPGLGYKSVIVKNFGRLLRSEAPLILGDGKQELDYVYVDDAVEGTIRALLFEGSGELFNIASGRGLSINELTREMLRTTGSSAAPQYGDPDVTAGTSRIGDPSKAERILGFKAQWPLERGLTATYEWLKTQADGSNS